MHRVYGAPGAAWPCRLYDEAGATRGRYAGPTMDSCIVFSSAPLRGMSPAGAWGHGVHAAAFVRSPHKHIVCQQLLSLVLPARPRLLRGLRACAVESAPTGHVTGCPCCGQSVSAQSVARVWTKAHADGEAALVQSPCAVPTQTR